MSASQVEVGHDPQGGGQVAGVPVADQPVPAAVAVLGGQQLGRGQGAGQLQHPGVLQDDLGAVAGVAGAGAVPPAQPLHRELGERHPADPDQPGRPGQHGGRCHVQQRPERERGDQQQDDEGSRAG